MFKIFFLRGKVVCFLLVLIFIFKNFCEYHAVPLNYLSYLSVDYPFYESVSINWQTSFNSLNSISWQVRVNMSTHTQVRTQSL